MRHDVASPERGINDAKRGVALLADVILGVITVRHGAADVQKLHAHLRADLAHRAEAEAVGVTVDA